MPDTGFSPPQQWTLKEFQQTLVVAPMTYSRPIAADGAAYLRQNTQHQIKVALPSPHMVGGRLWHADFSRDAYATRRDFIEAVIPILRSEVLALRDAGVDVVQFDDPWLCFFVDPEHRARFADPDAEVERAIDDLNRVVAGIDGIGTALHVCRGNRARTVYANGDYEPIMPFLLKANVDQLAMEFAVAQAGDIGIFGAFPTDKAIGLGVVDVRGRGRRSAGADRGAGRKSAGVFGAGADHAGSGLRLRADQHQPHLAGGGVSETARHVASG